jgi:hypothetical protein
MSVTTVTERLASILESIAGVERVYAGRPRDIPPSDFPAFVVFTDASTYDLSGDGMSDYAICQRTYRMVLLAMPWVMASELEAEAACRPFFDRVEAVFLDRQGLDHPRGENDLQGVQRTVYLGDSGVINIRLAGKDYSGVEFKIDVYEYIPRVYS